VVVDEAGMADTRSLAQLVQLVRAADGKLVLVGDDRQLPSVGAGGMFATLWHKKGGVELTENMRQVHPWMRDALEDLRAHRPRAALVRFDKNGLVHTSREESELREACVSGWFADRLDGHDTAILTHQNEDVEALNDMAHSMLEAEGEIGKPLVHLNAAREHPGVPGRSYNKGETIVFLRNASMARIGKNETVDVRNSNVGVVLSFDQANQVGEVELDNGARVWVKLAYLHEHTAYGYARTVHKIQGATVGRQDPERLQLGTAHIYRPESLGFEAAHVALSRATHSATLYVLEDPLPGEAVPGGASGIDARRAVLERVLRAWGQQRAERSATDWREILKANAKRHNMAVETGKESAGPIAPRASQARKAEHAPARRDAAGLAASFLLQSPGANGSGPELGSEPSGGNPGGNPGPASRPGAQSEGAAAPRGPKRPRLNVVERFMSIAEGGGAPGPVPTAGRAATTAETTGAESQVNEPANTPTNGFPKGVPAMADPGGIKECTAPELDF
ncbi:MAG: AAA family ATPase, partial [Actinomycetota bacterium]|nr:AAA family ATPase [Actinomycetota bacterium]